MSEIWVPDRTVRKWVLPRRPVGEGSDVQEMMCGHFQKKYDTIQEMIMTIGCMDELLSGSLYIPYSACKSVYMDPEP